MFGMREKKVTDGELEMCGQCCSSCLLDAETEVEQAVGGVRLSVGSFHLSDETTEAVTELGR